ncbi:MAG TPA: DUF2207 domain-containing protein [Candidatus Limnocylindria bacterium]|nr:DUF2207 domain-containing protein [Candidatus Limnocylindria bacterium]
MTAHTLRVLATVLLALSALLPMAESSARAADGGWTITSFDVQIEIQRDGRIVVDENLAVDFGPLEKHGIFRYVPVKYEWPSEKRKIRVYELQVLSVMDAKGRPWRYETSGQDANVEIKVGDPDRTLSGAQTYRIRYAVKGVLNSFADHDELFWNVTGGDWGVPILRSSATVRAPAALSRSACFVGFPGATAKCGSTQTLGTATTFTTGRSLAPGEQLTIVAALPKGVVSEPTPILQDRPREFSEFFDPTPVWLALAALVAILGLAWVFWRWFTAGRDDPDRVTIVPEYEPPAKTRPAQLGLLVDERADTLDVTASIVDLAVRGYLTITEIPKEGLFGSRDWLLAQKREADPDLLEYERTILDGLFDDGPEVKLSALKRHFYTTLGKAEKELYTDATTRGWFPADPSRVRATYAVAGVGLVVLAGAIAFGLGYLAGGGLVGIGAAVPAIALIAASPLMPRRTKAGAELARRALGFRQYMEVAEKDRQRFAEKEHIFAEYLPFAIVFKCVDQWAKAFQGIDLREATSTWYTGNLATFNAMDLSRDLSSFSGQLSTAIASTPGGSGSSGFGGGGGAGGGGGGGGGGSW